ncbi:hypothetical protein [Rhizobium alvei]|uniref:Fibronectin-binding protein n=1 Tax=Rhizobium alvei TaxID=1132659 RepID=A0ABT8YHP5_9HYPH|nr:hypothetical protein [Rhizobium alvei]MDO6963096.1 hypothetical protein [Rhizobium alvei]
MRRKRSLAMLAFTLLPGLALADPSGTYNVRGLNPDDGKEYTGTVEVSRTGETYTVVWEIAGTKFVGTGLGAKFNGDRFEMGPASPDDTAISVGYISSNSFGMAMYFQQEDGSWQGVWTYGGSKKAAPENWTPAD